MPAFSGALLTTIRDAAWSAITNGADTGTSVFKQFRYDGDPQKIENQDPSGYQDLPAIAIVPSDVRNEWVTNTNQDFDYFLDVLIYEDTLRGVEGSWEKVWQAIIRTVNPDTNLPYTRSAQGKPAALLGSTFERKTIGKKEKVRVWVARLTFGLRTQDQPHVA